MATAREGVKKEVGRYEACSLRYLRVKIFSPKSADSPCLAIKPPDLETPMTYKT